MSEQAKPSRWALWLPLALFVAFVALVLVGLLRPADQEVASAMIGKPAPQFALKASVPDRPGLASADLVGKPRLVNLFASWCAPCKAEAPQLQALKDAGVEIVGVANRDRAEDLAVFLKAYGNPYSRIGDDSVGAVQVAFGSAGVPETFVVDGKGVVRYQHIGDIRPEHVPLLLEKLQEAGR